MKGEITKPTEKDYAQLIEVWEASVRATHHFLTEDDISFFKPLILNSYFHQVDLYCMSIDGSIAGFIGLSDQKIEMLFVHPHAMGKGIGKQLCRFAMDERNVTEVDVNEQNRQAVGFYEHLGFVVVKRNPVDGLGKSYPILEMHLR